ANPRGNASSLQRRQSRCSRLLAAGAVGSRIGPGSSSMLLPVLIDVAIVSLHVDVCCRSPTVARSLFLLPARAGARLNGPGFRAGKIDITPDIGSRVRGPRCITSLSLSWQGARE